MLVFWKHSLVYLATPKTGTTAIHSALDPHADIVFRNPPGMKHSHLYRFERFLRPMLDRAEVRQWETMAVIREPSDWVASWYRYRQRSEIDGHVNSTRGLSYAQFIEEFLTGDPPPRSNIGTQHFFLEMGDAVGVSHIFAYEKLSLLMNFLQARLGIDVSLGRQNDSPPAPTGLSPDLQARLRQHLARDYAIWEAARTAGGHLRLGPDAAQDAAQGDAQADVEGN